MSARARWLAALILASLAGLAWYFAVSDRCLDSGGSWGIRTGCDRPPVRRWSPAASPVAADPAASSWPLLPRRFASGDLEVRLIDSTRWRVEEGMEMEGDRWHIAVRRGPREDTLPGLWVEELPVVVGDTALHGLVVDDQGALTDGFVVDLRSLVITSVPFNGTAIPRSFVRPRISPSGTAIAVWTSTGDGIGQVEIRNWPGQTIISTGPLQTVGGGDGDLGAVRWFAPDTLEYVIWAEEGRTLRGRLGPSGWSSPVDTSTP